MPASRTAHYMRTEVPGGGRSAAAARYGTDPGRRPSSRRVTNGRYTPVAAASREVVGVAAASGSYVVQDAGPRTGPGETQIEFPYTLRGIENALMDATFRSIGGPAQVIMLVSGGQSRVIRRYEHGKEVPVTP